MKAIILALSLIALCSSNATFLRELAADVATIDKFTFSCVTGLTLPTSFKATTTTDGAPAKTGTAAVTLHLKDVTATTNDLSYECPFTVTAASTGSSNLRNLGAIEATCVPATKPGTAAYGIYTVTTMVDKADTTKTYGISSATGNSLEFAESFELDGSQTTSQEVDSESDDKKTFKVALKAAVTATPKFYTNSTETAKEIPCELDKDKKNVICTPTKTQMDSGEKYTVQYKKPCDEKFTSTGITVDFSAASFMTVSKLLLVFAFLF